MIMFRSSLIITECISDLTSFMMECSDLSAPKSAKGFVKPSVKDVQVKRGATITYQPSQKARTWETTDTSESYLKGIPVSTLLISHHMCKSTRNLPVMSAEF